ncbi:MAG: hypothetical protein KAR01_04495 [Desulfocapsa sp.]|nr:hypothetical protein [Desulfocapsa sp.]
MKSKRSSRTGCLVLFVFLCLLVVAATLYYRNVNEEPAPDRNGVSWVVSVEKCKSKYEAYRPGLIKAPNCRKRTEDNGYFYFSWSRPLAILVTNKAGKITKISAKCNVSKDSGEIVYMSLGKTVIVNKSKK